MFQAGEFGYQQVSNIRVQQCLNRGAQINFRAPDNGNTALILATDANDNRAVEFLLKKGANPLERNSDQMIASELCETGSMIRSLLKDYELLTAVKNNYTPSQVTNILREGANINFIDGNGYTALMHAARQSAVNLVELLLNQGADYSMETTQGTVLNHVQSNEVNQLLQNMTNTPAFRR